MLDVEKYIGLDRAELIFPSKFTNFAIRQLCDLYSATTYPSEAANTQYAP